MSVYAKTLAAALCLVAAFTIEAVPARATVFGCSKDKTHYSCNKPAFTKVLKDAKIVAVESKPFDKISAKALQGLARELGKSVQPGSADLIFVLEPTDSDGIYFGPNDRELATLRIYSHGSKSEHGQLLWVESFVGQPDMPWPTVVHGAIQQFKAEFK